MNGLVTAAAAVVLAWSATPAAAFVVEVTTSMALADAKDQGELKTALQQAAVDNVLTDAISFTPTVIVLTHAVLVGDRLYVRLLLADQDGERTFDDLKPDDHPQSTPDTTDLQS